MSEVSAFAFFCEDLRREIGGRTTLIAIYPDTIEVPSFPGALRRLAVYFRIRFDVEGSFNEPIAVDLDVINGEVDHAKVEPIATDLIERTITKAKGRGLPFASLTARMELGEPVAISGPCQIRAMLNVGDQKQLCGLLNVILKPTPKEDASTASP